MASSTLPIPGSAYGPCETDCAHHDCAATRAMAAKNCCYCSTVIGYDRHFYDGEVAGTLVHASCYENACLRGETRQAHG